MSLRSAGLLICGAVAGFALALALIRSSVEVDYDSGHIRHLTRVGPLMVRQQDEVSGEFALALAERGVRLNGKPDWHTAWEFQGNQRQSPNFQGGGVVSAMNRLGRWFPEIRMEESRQLKTQFLTILRREGASAAIRFGEQQEERLQERLLADPKAAP